MAQWRARSLPSRRCEGFLVSGVSRRRSCQCGAGAVRRRCIAGSAFGPRRAAHLRWKDLLATMAGAHGLCVVICSAPTRPPLLPSPVPSLTLFRDHCSFLLRNAQLLESGGRDDRLRHVVLKRGAALGRRGKWRKEVRWQVTAQE